MLPRTVHRPLVARLVVELVGLVGLLALAGTAVQCSSSRDNFEGTPDAAPQGPLVSPPDAAVDAEAGVELEDCAGENKQIYVISPSPEAIYRFDPELLTFARLGYLDCPFSGAYSMAIDRRGVAWILFRGGVMAHVRLDDLRCSEITLLNRPRELVGFGMGFAKDTSRTGESLFLNNRDLFKVDPTTREISLVGPTAMPDVAEMAGTGDGQLFGYTPYNGVIAHFDKATGASLETYRTSAINDQQTGGEYAFAQWGGDFWTFTRFNPASSASVTRFSPATGESKVVVKDSGIRIIGAGSSTCAPFQPVN